MASNHRRISLPSFLYDLFTNIIPNKISATLDFQQLKEQANYRNGFSTRGHIPAINQAIEKFQTVINRYVYKTCIDHGTAFELNGATSAVKALKHLAIEETYVALFEDIYEGCAAMALLHK